MIIGLITKSVEDLGIRIGLRPTHLAAVDLTTDPRRIHVTFSWSSIEKCKTVWTSEEAELGKCVVAQ